MNFFHTALWYLENTADYFVQMLPCMAAAALLFFIVQPRRRERLEARGLVSSRLREGTLLVFVMFCAGLAALTLFPGGFWRLSRWGRVLQGELPLLPRVDLRFQLETIQWVPFLEIRRAFRGPWVMFIMVANVGLFCPIGFFQGLLWRRTRWWKAVGCGLAASVLIEFLQLFVGRNTDVDDVILNTAGTLAGYWLYGLLRVCLPEWTAKFQCSEKGDRASWTS